MPFGGLLTVGLITAGTGLVGSAIQAHQTSKAVDAEKQAGQENIQLQRDILAQQQANLAPWRTTGASAITTLGGLLGLPAAPAGGGTGIQGTGTLSQSYGSLPNDTQQGALTDPNKQPDASYDQSGRWIGNQSQLQRAAMSASTASGYTPQRFGSSVAGSPMLRVQAPDGRIYQIPAEKAGEAQQNGGTVLGPV